jgi:hypothetical protein
MQKLAFLVGTWSTVEQHEASPGMPAGSSTGVAFFRPGPGARSLIETFRASGSMGQFEGLGIVSWDPEKQLYNAYWCDSMTPAGCQPMGTGKWQGKDLVFTGQSDTGATREVYTDITPNSFTFHMFMGDAPKPGMTIKYSKVIGPRRPGPAQRMGAPPPEQKPAPPPKPPQPAPKP